MALEICESEGGLKTKRAAKVKLKSEETMAQRFNSKMAEIFRRKATMIRLFPEPFESKKPQCNKRTVLLVHSMLLKQQAKKLAEPSSGVAAAQRWHPPRSPRALRVHDAVQGVLEQLD
jgi:hypothetical protein